MLQPGRTQDVFPYVPPATPAHRAAANIAALETNAQQDLNGASRFIIARWSGWGALPDVFDPTTTKPWALQTRQQLDEHLTQTEITAASRSTQNAHYTPPEVAKHLWNVLARTLPTGQRSTVYEPGCGIGVFIATAPDHVDMVGVELDPVTAKLATALHPTATVVSESLVDHEPPIDLYDAAIGNVPFANVKLHDPIHNPDRRLSIHNLAIVKALASVKPDGHVLIITSAFTLDALNPAQRVQIARYGKMRHSIRLPEQTFSAHAGTNVVTDVLLLQRHSEGQVLTDSEVLNDPPTWLDVASVETGDGHVTINQTYLDNPDRIIGVVEKGGLYAGQSLRVIFEGDRNLLDDALKTTFDALAEQIGPSTDPLAPATGTTLNSPQPASANPSDERPPWIKPGGLYGTRASGFWQRTIGSGPDEPYTPVPKKDTRTLEAVCQLRDTYMTLVQLESNEGADSGEVERTRALLNDQYDRAVALAGPLSGYSTSTTRAGTEVRRYKPIGGFRKHDPDYATVTALETFDPDTQTATRSAIFHTRQLNPKAIHTCDTIDDAIAVSLHTTGTITVDSISSLLGISPEVAKTQLKAVAYLDPETELWVDAERYLSGNVRTKHTQAQDAASIDPTYQSNVDALASVIPDDIALEDIVVQIGAPWLTAQEHMAFLRDTLDMRLPGFSIHHDPTVGWVTSGNERDFNHYEAASSTWGTDRMNAVAIVAKTLRGERIVIYDSNADGQRWVNQEATVEANQKLEELNNALAEWASATTERAADFERRYNDRYNSHVAPTYQASWPHPPGLIGSITLRSHQAAGIKRMILDRQVGLFHVVGAGKTLTMAASAIEMKRLGLANKPLAVVPNHLIEQFTAEVQRAFPAARLLSPTDRSAAGRARFIGQCAADDYDLVITTAEMFKAIPVSTRAETDYLDQRCLDLRESLHAIKERGGDQTRGRTVKAIERRIQGFEERLKDLRSKPRDPSLTFEYMGVDMLLYDEVHYCKNLELGTARQDITGKPSQRALDLDLKVQLLRDLDAGNIMLATGTPVANSFWELWVMMRYLQPDVLHETGIYRFDDFAAQFGREITDFEMTPTGTWKLKTRFASFSNVPELQRIFRTTGDVKLASDLDLPRPTLHGNKPTVLMVPQSDEMSDFVAELADRAATLDPQRPEDDNMLKILTDGRKAAVSMRLVDREEPAITKLSTAATEIAKIYHATKAKRFVDSETGGGHPTPGALQIVFLDQGVTGGKAGHGIDLYAELRQRLSDLDVPNVAFIHDAKDPKELFRRCREGDVNVLVGSTAKMGTGMNVQTRAVALYHLDPPWRPADLEQRDGRILRQGNQNETIRIYYVISEGSLDVLSFQTLERKAQMITAVMSGTNTERTVHDLDDPGATFGDLKAIATGDERLVRQMRLKKKVGDLEVAKRSWERRTTQASRKVDEYRHSITATETKIEVMTPLIAQVASGELQATTYQSPGGHTADTYMAIDEHVKPLLPRLGGHRADLGTIAGHPLQAERRVGRQSDHYYFTIAGVELLGVQAENAHDGRLTQRIFNQIESIATKLDGEHDRLERLNQNLTAAQADQTAPFTRLAEYQDARVELDELERDIYNTDDSQVAVNPQRKPKAPSPPLP